MNLREELLKELYGTDDLTYDEMATKQVDNLTNLFKKYALEMVGEDTDRFVGNDMLAVTKARAINHTKIEIRQRIEDTK